MTEQVTATTTELVQAPGLYEQVLDVVKHNLSLFNIDDNIHFVDVEAATGKSLFNHYLDLWPEESRQQYSCKTCERWLNKYGQYVTINDGVLTSLAFDVDVNVEGGATDNAYALVNFLRDIVVRCPVVGVVVDNEQTYDLSRNDKFQHFSGQVACDNPALIFKKDDETRLGLEALARENVRIVKSTLAAWKSATLEKAQALFEYGQLKDSTKHKTSFEQYYRLHREFFASKNNTVKNNLVWEAVDTNNVNLIHFRSTVVGTLLDNLERFSEEFAIRTFLTQTNGINYQRPTEAPTDQQLEKAKQLVAELGLESAFARRFASLNDVKEWFWQPPVIAAAPGVNKGSIFDGMKTKDAPPVTVQEEVIGGDITIMRFVAEVLPKAKRLWVRPKQNPYRRYLFNVGQLTAATDPDSKVLLRHDSEDDRHTLASYVYHQGSELARWFEQIPEDIEVVGITTRVTDWGSTVLKYGVPENGIHLVLAGCQDRGNEQLGLFPEMIRHELRDIRRVVEEYSATHKLDPRPEGTQPAAGIFINSNVDVESGSGSFRIIVETLDGKKVVYTPTQYF